MKLVEKLEFLLVINKLNNINEEVASINLEKAFKDINLKQKLHTSKNLEHLLRNAIEDLRRVVKSKSSKLDRRDMMLIKDVKSIIFRVMKSMNMKIPTDKFDVRT